MSAHLKELLRGLVVVAISIFIYVNSFSIKVTHLDAETVSSATMPRFCTSLLFLLGTALFISAAVKWLKERRLASQKSGEQTAKTVGISKKVIIRTVGIAGLLAFYVITFNLLGFIISSVVFLFGSSMLLAPEGKRRIIPAVIISLAAPVAMYYLFANVFSMILPMGILG